MEMNWAMFQLALFAMATGYLVGIMHGWSIWSPEFNQPGKEKSE